MDDPGEPARAAPVGTGPLGPDAARLGVLDAQGAVLAHRGEAAADVLGLENHVAIHTAI